MLIFFGSLVFAENNSSTEDLAVSGEWDQFSNGALDNATENDSTFMGEELVEDTDEPSAANDKSEYLAPNLGGGEIGYTKEFYRAVWIGIGAILLFILFLYLLLKKPKNRWGGKNSGENNLKA